MSIYLIQYVMEQMLCYLLNVFVIIWLTVVKTIHPNSYLPGGAPVKVTNVKQCYRSCRNSTGSCYGFDYYRVNTTCVLHTTQDICGTLLRERRVVHYRMVTCGE